MAYGRRAARTDRNHAGILKHFRALGCSAHSTHTLGDGFPDAVVGVAGVNLLVEIKDGKKSKSKRKLTDDQVEFIDSWHGRVYVVECRDDVTRLVNEIRKSGVRLP